MTTTSASAFLPENFLCREMQFCSLCYSATPRVDVRIAHCADMPKMGLRRYQVKRRRMMIRHLTAVHPNIQLRKGGYPDSTRASA